MAAASALKMVASVVCVAMLLVQSSAYPASDGGAAPMDCPSPVSGCRSKCVEACNPLSVAMCQTICAWTSLGKTCVDTSLIFCMDICTAACQTVPSP